MLLTRTILAAASHNRFFSRASFPPRRHSPHLQTAPLLASLFSLTMSRDFSSKGGRDGGKRRKFEKKKQQQSGGAEGADGVDAWSKESIIDFQADQALLQKQLELIATANGSINEPEPESKDSEMSIASPTSITSSTTTTTSTSTPTTSSTTSTSATLALATSSPSPSPLLSPASPLNGLLPIDGSLLEGGGQVLRNAIAYSALLKQPIHIHHIRAGRPAGGGLKAQHLKGIELVHSMIGGNLKGAELHSKEVHLFPSSGVFDQLKNPTVEFEDPSKPILMYHCDIQSAGSVGLLIQVSLPVCLFMPYPVQLTLRGGTNASMAPIIDYSIMVFAPLMQQWFGLQTKFELVQRGFFPKGGGIAKVHTQPVKHLKAIQVTQRGTIIKITGIALVTHRLPAHIADRMAQQAIKTLHKELRDVTLDIKGVVASEKEAPIGDGVSMILLAHTSTGCILGASALGERGLPAEDVATNCVNQLMANLETGGCVDEYMQDQMILWMALAKGTSVVKTGPLTLHTRTCLFWAQIFTGCKIEVVAAKGNSSLHHPEVTDNSQTFLIKIEGVGYESRFHKVK